MHQKKTVLCAITILSAIVIGFIVYLALKGGAFNQLSGDTIQPISVNYVDGTINTSGATTITGHADTIDISGSGATSHDGAATITGAGTFILSGDFSKQITVDADRQIVTLVFSDANITNDSGAAIYITKAKRVYIAAAENTTNTIADAKYYTTDYGEEDVDAAIYSKDDLVFAGTGAIRIIGNHNHGIHSKDSVQMLSGSLDIQSANDGIVAKDYFAMKDGIINIESNSDGIKTTNDKDASLGYIALDGGNVTVASKGDAINSITRISIKNSNLTLTAGNGSDPAKADHGEWGKIPNENKKLSAKGLKAEKYIIITGGNLKLDTNDDAIHSSASIVINAGNISAKTNDDAIHSDAAITINGGTIDIARSHEGLEASVITINDGAISIVDEDDGLNASGGDEQASADGSKGTLYIHGGTLTINTLGDGIDSNGSIEMTGGQVTIDGPSNEDNGAIDFIGSFKITGGILIATSPRGMLQAPTDASQNVLAITLKRTYDANSVLRLHDEEGSVIAEFQPSKKYAGIVISTPNIKSGTTYTVKIDDEKVADLKVDNSITTYGDLNEQYRKQSR